MAQQISISQILKKLSIASIPTVADAKNLNISSLSFEEKMALRSAILENEAQAQAEATSTVEAESEHSVGEGYFAPIFLEYNGEPMAKVNGVNGAEKVSKVKKIPRTELPQVSLKILPFAEKLVRLGDKADIEWKAPTKESWMHATTDRDGNATVSVDRAHFNLKLVADMSLLSNPAKWCNSLKVADLFGDIPLAEYIATEIACHISKPVSFLLKADKNGNIVLVFNNTASKEKPFVV